MTDESLLQSLMDEWDTQRRAGNLPDPEHLCARAPHLLSAVRDRISAIVEMEKLFQKQEQTISRDDGSFVTFHAKDSPLVSTEARYRVIRSYAQGGLGEVLLAEDEVLRRPVALKRMKADTGKRSARRQRFLREAMITGQLDHPGIVSILNTGEDASGQPLYVMKFIEGETLAEAVRRAHESFAEGTRRGSVRSQDFVKVVLRPLLGRFLTICNTVAYAHGQGVVHRDLKPANMMLADFGATYVVDWGLAKRVSQGVKSALAADANRHVEGTLSSVAETLVPDEELTEDEQNISPMTSLTGTGAVIGTPAYMSPEQARGEKALTGKASDIYSLGATLYFLVTAQPPITVDSSMTWIDAVTSGRYPMPRERQSLVPASLESICLKAMALKPDDRYASVLELAADLERWLNDDPVSAFQEPWMARVARLSRRHRAWTQAGLAGLAVVSIVSIFFLWQLQAKVERAESAELAATILAGEKSKLAEKEQSARKTADEQASLALATLRSVIFRIARNLENVEGAAEVRTQLLTTAVQGLNKVAKTLETRIEADRALIAAHNDIGKIYMFVGNLEKVNSSEQALHHFQQARQIGEQMLKETPNDSSLQRDVSVSLELMGDILIPMGRLDEADKAYAQSLAISEQRLKQTPDDIKCMQDAGFGYEKVADGLLTRGETAKARPYLERCVGLYQKIVDLDPKNASYRRDLIVGQSKFGNVLRNEERYDEAAALFRGCIDGCKALENIPDSGAQLRDRAVNLNKLGSVLLLQNNSAEALRVFGESLEISRAAFQADPRSVTSRHDLSIVLKRMADASVAGGDPEKARVLLTECLPIRRELATEDAANQALQVELAGVLADLCSLELDSNQSDKAAEYLKEAEALLKGLSEKQRLEGAEEKTLLNRLSELRTKLGG